ncbi:pyridoxal phosphate-dependent aminotransferase [Tateyamaria pelophila]|uniref:pyridoxal phosphate-dependent aminotransferase n=1 Tax=Tateyamaria pelophila TaxID=328415 RepID=UPI001CC0475A|nr:pyridoxal phosphate-dependent aminotransferase [Tateyamaria pelophila]
MTDLRLTPLAASLPSTVPFVGPEAQERLQGRAFAARLGANESVFGPSPKATAAMAETDQWKYGDPESYELRTALAAHYGLDMSHIMIGEGIDALLGYLVRLFVGPGDHVVTSLGAYPTFNYHVAGYGGTLHTVPYVKDHEDPASLFATAAEVGAKLVYLSNPDNPMGTWHDAATLEAALDHLPDGCVLVLDEAYIECAPDGTAPRIDPTDPRVIRMRTFSKVYGLAGARVGYAIGAAPIIDAFNKVRNHFGMNRSAQAGALAALADQAYLSDVAARIEAAKARIATIAHENGLQVIPSATNFIAIDCGADGAFAKAVLEALIEEGIFVRMPFAAPQNRCIRISCGTDADLDLFAAALPVALKAAKGG